MKEIHWIYLPQNFEERLIQVETGGGPQDRIVYESDDGLVVPELTKNIIEFVRKVLDSRPSR